MRLSIKNRPVVLAGGAIKTGKRLPMGNMPRSRPNQVWKIIASQNDGKLTKNSDRTRAT